MTTWFVITLMLNLLVAVVYLIVQCLRQKAMRRSCFLKALIMVVCPVVGPLCFFVAYLVWILSRQSADLEDVIFSKERVTTYKVPEEHKEINVVSMEDALAVSDRENLRNLMMNVVCDDDGDSLTVISKGLRAEDSETSHYAASVLQEKLGVYRRHVKTAFMQILNVEDSEERTIKAAELLEYMIPMLKRNVFGAAEMSSLVQKADALADVMTASEKKWLDAYIYDDLFHVAMLANEAGIAEKWCNRFIAEYPETQNAYICRLHLYYKQGRHEEFRQTMEELKRSEVVVDAQLLEWIRMFG